MKDFKYRDRGISKSIKSPKVVEDFDAAARAFAFKGAAHPDEWDSIEHNYVRAKLNLIKKLRSRHPIKIVKGKNHG